VGPLVVADVCCASNVGCASNLRCASKFGHDNVCNTSLPTRTPTVRAPQPLDLFSDRSGAFSS